MALTWNIEKVENKSVTRNEDGISATTETLIFATIHVGMTQITEANWEKFYTRIHIYEQAFGAMMSKVEDGELKPHFMPPEMVKAHIGLHTNAGNMTDAQFKKRVFDRLQNEAQRALHNAKRKMETENGDL